MHRVIFYDIGMVCAWLEFASGGVRVELRQSVFFFVS